MFRPGLLATLSALILTGCVSPYTYRDDAGGDYYYSEPQVEYYDVYGRPWGTIGYGYPGGWYGSFGYLYGHHLPYSRFGFPYGYYGGYYGYPYHPYYGPPYFHHPYPQHRPPHPPGPPGNTPRPPPPGGRPGIGDRDHDREGGPWRHLNELPRRRVAVPQPAIPGTPGMPGMPGAVGDPPPRSPPLQGEGPRRPPVRMTQPAQEASGDSERVRRPPPRPAPQPSIPVERPRSESPRPMPPAAGRMERPERESRRDPTP